MSVLTVNEMTKLAYKTMNPTVYYTLTILIYFSLALLGDVLNDLGLILGFVGTLGGTGMSFIMPSWLFLNGYRKMATRKYKEENGTTKCLAICNLLTGFCAFSLFLYNNILAITATKDDK